MKWLISVGNILLNRIFFVQNYLQSEQNYNFAFGQESLMNNINDKKRTSAQRRVKNTINKSPTKALYTFSKAERFPNKMYRSVTDFRYDVGLKKYDKKVNFSTTKRTSFWKDNGVPGPTKYSVKDSFSQKKIIVQFKRGREQCKANSVFIPNQNPGPGNYQPNAKNKYKSIHYSLRKKCQTQQSRAANQTPGPIYQIQSTIPDENKYLSIYVRRSSTRICHPQSVFPRKKNQSTPIHPIPSQTVETSYITSRGGKLIGKSGPFALQTCSKRLFEQIYESKHKLATPGPGYYQSFSQFQGDNAAC